MASGARRILLNTAATTLPNLVGSLGSFLLYIVMARKLGAGEFGVFTFGLSFAALVTELGSFGQDWTAPRALLRAIERRLTSTSRTRSGSSSP